MLRWCALEARTLHASLKKAEIKKGMGGKKGTGYQPAKGTGYQPAPADVARYP
jgi:hypothetical protein